MPENGVPQQPTVADAVYLTVGSRTGMGRPKPLVPSIDAVTGDVIDGNGYRVSVAAIEAARIRAEAAADAAGARIFVTRAEADAALAALGEGDVVEVAVDTDGLRRRYRVEGGAYVAVVTLPSLDADGLPAGMGPVLAGRPDVGEPERRGRAGEVVVVVGGQFYAVPLLRFQGAPRSSWFRDLAQSVGNPALEDWRPALQKLLTEAAESGTREAIVDDLPAGYRTRGPLYVPDHVTLRGGGGRPLIYNASTVFGDSFVLHTGWSHEADWGFMDTYAVTSFAGRTVTFADPADAARWAPGDLVVVAINDFSEQGGSTARNSVVNVMARVVSVAGAAVEVDEPAEAVATSWDPALDWGAGPGVHPNGGAPLELRATRLDGHLSLGHPTGICDSPTVRDLSFRSDLGSWAVRSAVYNGVFENLRLVRSNHAVGGNFQVRCLFDNIQGFFDSKAVDVAEGCRRSTYRGINVALHPLADVNDVASAMVVVRGQCELVDSHIDGGEAAWSQLVLARVGSGLVRDSRLAGRSTVTGILADAVAPQDVGRFRAVGVDCDFKGSTTVKQAAWLKSPGAHVEGCTFRNGSYQAASRAASFTSVGGAVVGCSYLDGLAETQIVQSNDANARGNRFDDNFFDKAGPITQPGSLVPSDRIRLRGNYTRDTF